jgi:hypothetical protein
MEQMQLLLRDRQKEVALEIITSQGTFKDALRLCKSVSGLTDAQLCQELDIEPAQWSRIFGNSANFPESKLPKFMHLCGSVIPLIWLAYVSGYSIRPLQTELEQALDEATRKNSELELKLSTIRDFFRDTAVKL